MKLLALWGFEVASADCVESAVILLRNLRFDALLSDIGLPDGSGLQVIAEARRHGGVALAVALSAYCTAADREAGLSAGFDHYLSKPTDIIALRSLLQTAA